MASNLVSTISSEWVVYKLAPGERSLLIQTLNGGRRDGQTNTGYGPDVHRTKAGCTPDEIQVAQATLDLTRSVRDGVYEQVT